MEWGFALALIGLIVVLVSTIWFYAGRGNQLARILSTTTPIVDSQGRPVTHTQPGCTPGTVPATGANISLQESVALLSTPSLAIAGWVIGAIMIIGGVIWGLIERGRKKPDSTLASLLPAALLQQQLTATTVPAVVTTAPAVVAAPVIPAATSGLTAADVAAIRRLLAASPTSVA